MLAIYGTSGLMYRAAARYAIERINAEGGWNGEPVQLLEYDNQGGPAGAADKLVSASSPAAERVETHVTMRDGDISRMREVKGYEVPARGTLELKPGGSHLMLVNIKAPLKEGTSVPLTLRFEKAGEIKTELQVRPLAGGDPHSH